MSALAPSRVMSFAIATEATTGITRTPEVRHTAIYFDGLPAPVVTTATRSSQTSWASSSI